MTRNKSRSILSLVFQLGSNRRSTPPVKPSILLRRGPFFSVSSHAIKRPPPPPLGSRRLATPWHDGKIVVVTAIASSVAYAAAYVRYGETEPFGGRTRLALLSHQEARELDEASFAKYKKKHAGKILSPGHPDTIRVRGIAHEIIRAAHYGLAISRQLHAPPPTSRHEDGLQWMDGLDWEVLVLRDDDPNAECFPAAGKIVVYTGTLHNFKNDAEVAVTVAHEVGHVIARHSSGIIDWLDLEKMPILILPILLLLFPVILPYKRRCELEADHIGLMLLAAAGVDPIVAVLVRQKKANIRGESKLTECLSYVTTHPSSKKRWQFLSQPKVMDEALELYKRVTSHHTRLINYDMRDLFWPDNVPQR